MGERTSRSPAGSIAPALSVVGLRPALLETSFSRGPLFELLEYACKRTPVGAQRVMTCCVLLEHAGVDQLGEASGENAGRDAAARLEGAEAERAVVQLPKHAQGPAAAEKLEHLQHAIVDAIPRRRSAGWERFGCGAVGHADVSGAVALLKEKQYVDALLK